LLLNNLLKILWSLFSSLSSARDKN